MRIEGFVGIILLGSFFISGGLKNLDLPIIARLTRHFKDTKIGAFIHRRFCILFGICTIIAAFQGYFFS